MVMRRGDARHKDVPDPLDAGPKRITTIHAQRKFAQGSGMNSPVMSPIKEKEKAKVNGGAADSSPATSPSTSGAPAKRPRTEDFITFLCYRGTPYLPSELNHFNVPSKPEKNDREAASSSKQTASSSRQQDKDDNLKRAKQNKRMVMQSKSKVFDQRQRKSRMNVIAKKGKVLKSTAQTPISKDRLKKAVAATVAASRGKVKGRTPVVRASHPAILKRLGASRARAGLRSGGQLPPGSDVGIKTDRKPRPENEKSPETKRNIPASTKSRGKVALPNRMQGKRGAKVTATPVALKLKSGKVLKGTPKLRAHPKSLNLAARPSRKTKEAATLYMEMITKDLRSPDEDDDMSPLIGPRDVDFHLTPVKTRTRSAIVDETSPPLVGSSKKNLSSKANGASPSLSPTPSARRSLKLSSGSSAKRTMRGTFKEDESNADTPKVSPVRGRPGRKSASDNTTVQSTSKVGQRNPGNPGKKSLRKTPQVEESFEVDESSHSEEDEQDKSSLPAAKKSKRGSKSPKLDKHVASKKSIHKNPVLEASKKGIKAPEKSSKVADVELDQTKKRSTRSGGANSSQELEKDHEKDRKPVVRKGNPRGSSIKKDYSSESEDEEDSKKKPVGKKTRLSIKKEESDSNEEAQPQPNLVGKSSRQARSSTRALDNAEDKDDRSLNQRQSRTAKSTKIKPTDGESDSDEEFKPQPKTTGNSTRPSRASAKIQGTPDDKMEKPLNQRQSRAAKSAKILKTADSESENEKDAFPARKPGRPKKTTGEEVGKPTESQEKRGTRKSTHSIDDKIKQIDVKPAKKAVQPKPEENDSESDLDTEEHSPVRRTRTSNPVESVDSDNSKAAPKTKRGRVSGVQPGKAKEDSGSEDVSSRKIKRASRPEVKVETSSIPEKDDTHKGSSLRNSLPAKQSSSKSDVEKQDAPKNLKKLKEVVKAESGGESDKEAKLVKLGKKPPSNEEADKETCAKAGVKAAPKALGKVEMKEDAAPKRNSRSGPVTLESDKVAESNDAKPKPLSSTEKMEKGVPVPAKRGRKPKQVQESGDRVGVSDSDKKPSAGDEILRGEDMPAKRGRKPKSVETESKERKEVTRPTRKSGGDDAFKDVNSEAKKESVSKHHDQAQKLVKKPSDKSAKSDSENQAKDTTVTARRGRKPKKVEESEESDEEKPVEKKTRPRRSTRTVIKRESYSEFSDDDIEEMDDEDEDYDDGAPRRTRGRKSNVKYTEKDTDDSLSAESESEKRPQRSRRSVFSTTLAIDLDSDVDDDFLDSPTKPTKSKPETEILPEETGDFEVNSKHTPKETKAQPRKLSAKADEKVLSNGTGSKNTVSQPKTSEKPKADGGEGSDSSKKTKAPKASVKLGNADEPASKAPVDVPDETPLLPTSANAAGIKGVQNSIAVFKPSGSEQPEKMVEGNDIASFQCKVDIPKETLNATVANVEVQMASPEPKRVTRRLSRDTCEMLEQIMVKVEAKPPDQIPGLSEKLSVPHQPLAGNFDLSATNKDYDNNNGLAILSDVAFSELQNRKNIMDRKLSSDSATSFSSDEVPTLPVRKDKVVPKAKADLPTVRENTESDEELSDEMGSDSPYDEYRKSDKLRRKRLPKRTRREPARQISQRPVRNRRAKLASYIDDESFSSDRSSSPEIPVKPIQKKRKSVDKPVDINTAPVPAPKPVIPVSSVPVTSAAAPVVPSVTVPKTPKEPVLPSKPKEIKPSVQPRVEPPKLSNVHRNDEVKKPVPKPNIPADPILSIPRPPQPVKDVKVKNENSVTLFSGVSGVQVTMSDTRLTSVHPHREVGPQMGHVKRSNPEALAKPPPYVPSRPAVSSSQSFSKSSLFNMKTAPDIAVSSSADVKAKPSNLDTWKNAFINAKIPKPGQLSPAHHSSAGTPFMRKTFSNSPKTPTKPEDKPTAFVPTKLPGVQTFKTSAFQNLGKLGNQSPRSMPGGMSPGRPPVSTLVEPKPHVYLSPSRVKSSPSKDDKVEPKKPPEIPKSLTLLQYEKRSQEVVSSLKGSQPVLVDGVQSYVPAFPTKLKEYSMEKTKISQARQPPVQTAVPEETAKAESGKHTNLPFAVDSALRKRSPITVKKPVKAVEKKAVSTITIPEVPPAPAVAPRLTEPSTSVVASPTAKLELLSKKKVQMTNEEINKWLDDSTSTGVEHAKDCGIFENNQCECSYRTSGESMLNSSVGTIKEEPKIDHGVVEPPVQLKELDSGDKFTAETISTCKVEEYKEKLLLKSPAPQTPEIGGREIIPPGVPKVKKPVNLSMEKGKRKTSMTEDEMCEYGFRFERNAHSSRESGSDMSSPTPRDDVSSSNEEKFDGSPGEKKSIFLQRRQKPPALAPASRKPLSKSPCAFSAENESSVYAFEDAPPPAVNNPFRRRGSRHKSNEDDGPASSSIAVQVNLEPSAAGDAEQVLECSTQTEQVDNEGQLFYFPLEGDSNPQEVIQGVQVKLQSSEGPEQKVIMKAKLVTKPSVAPTSAKPVRPLGDAGRAPQRPEQKVRPLATTSTSTQSRPPVGTVSPTVREQPSSSTSVNSQGTATNDRPELTNQSTQAAAVPQLVAAPSPQQPAPTPEPVKAEPSAVASAPKPSPKSKSSLLRPTRKPTKEMRVGKSSTPTTSAPRRSSHNEFPMPGTTPRMVEALTFYPTEKEFQDPLEYIERITPQAQTFGICRIVPPSSFKPECKVSDDMRFTAYNQYVHKMLYRWGPNVREMTAIKKYLATQSIALKQPPYIGGMEIDLPRLYQTVQSCGGLKEVIEKKRWAKVADMMKIPKAAQDRVTKLDDLYCKFLLPYDTLSHAERSKLLEEVDMEWTERERRIALEAERESKGEKEEKEENSDSEEESDDGRDECITKGKTMPLSGFYRIARNTMAMWFKEPNPSFKEVENEYWKQVTSRKQHVCVNSGSIDSGSYGYGFPTSKSSSTARHPWNLKVLTNNSGSILRSMGPVMGVTVPTLHVGMLFSACCWYRDPHGLPWIEYLHTGANKIWYAVPDLWNEELHGAMRTILPRYCQDKPIWLASDTAMVPPDLLVQQGVSLCRAVQEPGQFILVFPKAFTSTICTGYIVSESVYFAQPSWLNNAKQIFKDIQESCEPPVFSLERLLFNIATDARSTAEVLTQVLPMIIELRDTELRYREQLRELGVIETERLAVSKGGRKRSQEEPEEYECELCRGNLYLSLVTNTVEEANFCLLHAVESLSKDRSHSKNCKLMYSYDEEEMNEVLEKIKQRIETKTVKKLNSKSTGGSSKV